MDPLEIILTMQRDMARKLDALGEELQGVKLALAEKRGERRVVVWLAGGAGVAGGFAYKFVLWLYAAALK
jgi:hypothetical protein